jgi:hypothetical protein
MHPGQIDPAAPEFFRKPLWAVYGHDCFPSLIACIVSGTPGNLAVWGYSVYRRAGGYRTLGQSLEKWSGSNNARFFANQDDAIGCMRKLTTPSAKALKELQA